MIVNVLHCRFIVIFITACILMFERCIISLDLPSLLEIELFGIMASFFTFLRLTLMTNKQVFN